jgi:hypothetical protein
VKNREQPIPVHDLKQSGDAWRCPVAARDTGPVCATSGPCRGTVNEEILVVEILPPMCPVPHRRPPWFQEVSARDYRRRFMYVTTVSERQNTQKGSSGEYIRPFQRSESISGWFENTRGVLRRFQHSDPGRGGVS